MAEQGDSVEQMTEAEQAAYWRQRKSHSRDMASELVRLAAEITQAMWEEGRRIFVREAEYPALLLLVEMGLYRRLEDMARREWIAGWGLTGDDRIRLAVMAPGGTATVVGSPTMAAGTWWVVRATTASGEAAPVGGEQRG
jgi:hypothetical protein